MSTYTTSGGVPVDDDDNVKTAGPYGPVLLTDHALIDKLSHFDRERIPERVVHAKGAGAHGFFEVTHDVSMYCKAKVFNKVGKRTPVFTRFSTVGGEKGSADSARDPRGFAVKHYTEDGIWDMVGNNTPVFFIRDPSKFSDFIHTQKRAPETNLPDPDMFWDFLSLVPESLHQVTVLFSDRGTPKTYRNMNGYTSHTFKWTNAQGESFWIKLHYKTNQGIDNFTGPEADAMKATDPDWHTRDLFHAIKAGDFPSWTVHFQCMTIEDGLKYKFNIFDVTKVWPHADAPLMKLGQLVLNRNPENYYADVEQAAFSPGHLVPGMEVSFDKMLQARVFSYPDTHRHRLGINYQQIPVNAPLCPVNNYQRDGYMSTTGNQGAGPNYWPNSIDGAPEPELAQADPSFEISGYIARHPQKHPNDDFVQPRALFRDAMNDEDREHLVQNFAGHLKSAAKHIQERQISLFTRADPEWGRRVREAIESAEEEKSDAPSAPKARKHNTGSWADVVELINDCEDHDEPILTEEQASALMGLVKTHDRTLLEVYTAAQAIAEPEKALKRFARNALRLCDL